MPTMLAQKGIDTTSGCMTAMREFGMPSKQMVHLRVQVTFNGVGCCTWSGKKGIFCRFFIREKFQMGNAINGFLGPWIFMMLKTDSTPASNAAHLHKGINKVGFLKYLFTKFIGSHVENLFSHQIVAMEHLFTRWSSQLQDRKVIACDF